MEDKIDFSNLFVVVQYTHQHVLRIVVVVYTHQHVLCIVVVVYTHINTCYVLLYSTRISTRVMYCCIVHAYQHVLCMLYSTRISTRAMYCCYC